MDPAGGAGKGISGRLIGAVSGKTSLSLLILVPEHPLSGSIRFPVRFPRRSRPVASGKRCQRPGASLVVTLKERDTKAILIIILSRLGDSLTRLPVQLPVPVMPD